MNKKVLITFFLIFLFVPFFEVSAQSDINDEEIEVFDTTGLPQWVKDTRRFDIIAFGTFPFSMFFTTFFYDLHRWNKDNGMSFQDRSYAPWPFKSAGAVDMTNQQFKRSILIAAGVSVVLAITDLLIVKYKRNQARRALEIKPPSGGTFSVVKTYPENDAPDKEKKTSEIPAGVDIPVETDNSPEADEIFEADSLLDAENM